MSTAYPPRLIKWAFSSKQERNAARSSPMTPGFYGQFPATLGLYYDSPGTDFLSQYFYLATVPLEGQSIERKDMYAVSFFKGPGLRQTTVYSTPEHGSTPMAVAVNETPYSSSASIKLPGVENGSPRTEKLRYNGIAANTYTFRYNGGTFELHDDKSSRPRQRRIIRINDGIAHGRKESKSKIAKPQAQDADNQALIADNRVVATWSEGTVPNRDGRLATLRFANEAVIEELGEYWALLAVTAILAACQQGPAIEGTHVWHEEKMLEKGQYR